MTTYGIEVARRLIAEGYRFEPGRTRGVAFLRKEHEYYPLMSKEIRAVRELSRAADAAPDTECRECGAEFPAPPVGKCPQCGGRYLKAMP